MDLSFDEGNTDDDGDAFIVSQYNTILRRINHMPKANVRRDRVCIVVYTAEYQVRSCTLHLSQNLDLFVNHANQLNSPITIVCEPDVKFTVGLASLKWEKGMVHPEVA